MADPFNYDVFLSHSSKDKDIVHSIASKDKDIVHSIAERLRADGLRGRGGAFWK